MVSDQEIAKAVETLLRQSDPNAVTTLNGVVQQLEAKLGLDLSHKAVFIREQINLLLRSHPQPLPPKDHFALQHHPQFPISHPQFNPHFALQQQQQQHHHRPENLNFLNSQPQPTQQIQSQQQQHHRPENLNSFNSQPQPPQQTQSQQHHHRPENLNFLNSQPQPPQQTQSQQHHHQRPENLNFLNSQPQPPQRIQSQQHHHRPENLNFLNSQPQPPPQTQLPAEPQLRQPQVQPDLVFKAEASVQDAPPNTSDTPKESAPAVTKRRGGPGGLNKVCGVSPELQVIVGEPALPRTEIVKQLWAYIRKNNLQDPSNKRKIICDDALRVVFETDCTDMFKMNKLLAKHIIRLEPTKESGRAKKLKVDVESPIENTESSPPLVIISEALANFFGTGEREALQSEVLRRVWEYIKVNNLEDPLNSMVILCDAKLQQLFGCESISALGISEMLARHHLFKQ